MKTTNSLSFNPTNKDKDINHTHSVIIRYAGIGVDMEGEWSTSISMPSTVSELGGSISIRTRRLRPLALEAEQLRILEGAIEDVPSAVAGVSAIDSEVCFSRSERRSCGVIRLAHGQSQGRFGDGYVR
jgi:hypothetical protein